MSRCICVIFVFIAGCNTYSGPQLYGKKEEIGFLKQLRPVSSVLQEGNIRLGKLRENDYRILKKTHNNGSKPAYEDGFNLNQILDYLYDRRGNERLWHDFTAGIELDPYERQQVKNDCRMMVLKHISETLSKEKEQAKIDVEKIRIHTLIQYVQHLKRMWLKESQLIDAKKVHNEQGRFVGLLRSKLSKKGYSTTETDELLASARSRRKKDASHANCDAIIASYVQIKDELKHSTSKLKEASIRLKKAEQTLKSGPGKKLFQERLANKVEQDFNRRVERQQLKGATRNVKESIRKKILESALKGLGKTIHTTENTEEKQKIAFLWKYVYGLVEHCIAGSLCFSAKKLCDVQRNKLALLQQRFEKQGYQAAQAQAISDHFELIEIVECLEKQGKYVEKKEKIIKAERDTFNMDKRLDESYIREMDEKIASEEKNQAISALMQERLGTKCHSVKVREAFLKKLTNSFKNLPQAERELVGRRASTLPYYKPDNYVFENIMAASDEQLASEDFSKETHIMECSEYVETAIKELGRQYPSRHIAPIYSAMHVGYEARYKYAAPVILEKYLSTQSDRNNQRERATYIFTDDFSKLNFNTRQRGLHYIAAYLSFDAKSANILAYDALSEPGIFYDDLFLEGLFGAFFSPEVFLNDPNYCASWQEVTLITSQQGGQKGIGCRMHALYIASCMSQRAPQLDAALAQCVANTKEVSCKLPRRKMLNEFYLPYKQVEKGFNSRKVTYAYLPTIPVLGMEGYIQSFKELLYTIYPENMLFNIRALCNGNLDVELTEEKLMELEKKAHKKEHPSYSEVDLAGLIPIRPEEVEIINALREVEREAEKQPNNEIRCFYEHHLAKENLTKAEIKAYWHQQKHWMGLPYSEYDSKGNQVSKPAYINLPQWHQKQWASRLLTEKVLKTTAPCPIPFGYDPTRYPQSPQEATV